MIKMRTFKLLKFEGAKLQFSSIKRKGFFLKILKNRLKYCGVQNAPPQYFNLFFKDITSYGASSQSSYPYQNPFHQPIHIA